MPSARPILIGTIWPSSIPLRIWALFNIYKILEFLLTLLHDSGIINLGSLKALFLRRNALADTLYYAIYLQLSPVLNAIFWGVMVKCTMVSGFWRFASPTVAVIGLGVAGIWLRSGCFPDNGGQLAMERDALLRAYKQDRCRWCGHTCVYKTVCGGYFWCGAEFRVDGGVVAGMAMGFRGYGLGVARAGRFEPWES